MRKCDNLNLKARVCIALLILATFSNLLGQRQASVWHFGDGRCLNFNSGTPVNVSGSQIFTIEGSASYCDEFGNLLFYTNGGGDEAPIGQEQGHIWNRNNAVMYNMQGLEGGGYSAKQSSVIVEAPGQDSVYYVFTMDQIDWDNPPVQSTIDVQPNGRGLSYFTVDMRLNNGLGDVVLADQRVYAPSAEGLCAVRHANGRDFWIIVNQDSSGFGVYSLTPTGLAFSSVFPAQVSRSIIKASPDGAFVAAARAVPFQPNIFRFNNATGELSNPVALPLPNFVWSWEFSPNSRYFYISQRVNPPATTCNILRYDLQAPSIPASVSTIGTVNNLASDMQLALDGKIYFCTFEFLAPFSSTINRINCPNTANPTLETNLFIYSNTVPCIGLPTFPAWLFDNDDDTFVSLGPDSLRLCDVGGEIVLDAQNPDASYVWSNGSTSQTITVTEPGTYSVAVAGSCGNGSAQIVILPCDICVTSSSSITETACESYTSPWGTVYTQSGVYTDTLSTAAGCDSIITLNLTVNPPLALEALPESVSIALGDTVQLSAIGASSYVWSPTEGLSCSNCASPLASPQESTIYTVTGTDSLGCTKTDTLRIEVDIICNEVFIPTIFSPNDKGPQVNEMYCILSDCVEQFKLVIHNRWGEKVFESEDINQCWDGKFKGIAAQTGVYAYNVYLRQLDGTEINKTGAITLVR